MKEQRLERCLFLECAGYTESYERGSASELIEKVIALVARIHAESRKGVVRKGVVILEGNAQVEGKFPCFPITDTMIQGYSHVILGGQIV